MEKEDTSVRKLFFRVLGALLRDFFESVSDLRADARIPEGRINPEFGLFGQFPHVAFQNFGRLKEPVKLNIIRFRLACLTIRHQPID